MSKTFRIAIETVVATAMIVGRIIGSTIRKKTWRSLAPSGRAPLQGGRQDDHREAGLEPDHDHDEGEGVDRRRLDLHEGDRLIAERRPRRVDQPELWLAGRLPGIHEAPDDGRPD